VQQLGDMIEIDAAALVEHDGERVGGEVMIGGAGGAITRSVKIGPGLAVSVSRS
jgi:hypothetical protein